MNRVNGVFCYGCVLLNGRWHLPAYSCSMSKAESEILRSDNWVQVTECRSGKQFTIRELLSETYPVDFPEELVRLKETIDDPLITRKDRWDVMIAQHTAYIITDTDLSEIPMPCFFFTEYSDLSAFRATAALSNYQICDLPEVVDSAKPFVVRDKWDYLLIDHNPGGKIRPPQRVWFPMSIEGTAGAYPGVYRINEWQGQHIAAIEGFVAATPADVQVGDRLSRMYEGNECDIGVISQMSSIELLRC